MRVVLCTHSYPVILKFNSTKGFGNSKLSNEYFVSPTRNEEKKKPPHAQMFNRYIHYTVQSSCHNNIFRKQQFHVKISPSSTSIGNSGFVSFPSENEQHSKRSGLCLLFRVKWKKIRVESEIEVYQ